MNEYIVQKVIKSDPVSEPKARSLILKFLEQQQKKTLSTSSMSTTNAEALEVLQVMAHCLTTTIVEEDDNKSTIKTKKIKVSSSPSADDFKTPTNSKKDQKRMKKEAKKEAKKKEKEEKRQVKLEAKIAKKEAKKAKKGRKEKT